LLGSSFLLIPQPSDSRRVEKNPFLNYRPSKEKPEEPPSGFKEELLQSAGSSSHILSFYFIFRLFARPEACLFCY
jgi:hypothetical protein